MAVPADAFSEYPHFGSTVADKTWTPAKLIERIGAWQIEPICITSPVLSARIIRVVHTLRDVELYRFPLIQEIARNSVES